MNQQTLKPAITPDDDIERLLRAAWAGGEWADEHEEALQRWRARRGERGKTGWRWWWKLPEGDLYATDHTTREEALIEALRQEPGVETIELIAARCWDDDLKDGDDTQWFADERNHEIVPVSVRVAAAND